MAGAYLGLGHQQILARLSKGVARSGKVRVILLGS
jgi:hypothetical protein